MLVGIRSVSHSPLNLQMTNKSKVTETLASLLFHVVHLVHLNRINLNEFFEIVNIPNVGTPGLLRIRNEIKPNAVDVAAASSRLASSVNVKVFIP